jgi:hypothetical protein
MANILYANNAAGTLNGGITNVQTTLTLNAGQAALFPNPVPPQVFYVTLTDAATQTLIEIVKVTAVSGNVFSIVRGQDGTSALSWNSGDIVSQRAIRLEMQGWENAAEGQFSAQNVAITPSTTLGIVGTATTDNANPGAVGEYLSNTGLIAAFTSGSPVNATALNLTAGDWEVQGTFVTSGTGGASITDVIASVSLVSGVLSGIGNYSRLTTGGLGSNGGWAGPTPTARISLAAPATVFLVAQIAFASGSNSSQGFMKARRVR